MSSDSRTSDVSELTLEEKVLVLSLEFSQVCQERHEAGAEEYGGLTFLDNDTIGMALEELADVANYARYTYIRLRLLNLALDEKLGNSGNGHDIPLGKDAFTPTQEH